MNSEDKYTPEFLNRFWAKVDIKGEDDCWLWKASTCNHYGQMRLRRKKVFAHRLSYELHLGDPGVLNVLHTCDTPLCVNPKHLFLGTHLDNMRDMVRKYRSCRGETHGRHKLLSAQVDEIRRLYSVDRLTHAELGRMFNVSRRNIGNIVNFQSWKEAEGHESE